MRPGRYAPDNDRCRDADDPGGQASMRPGRYAPDNQDVAAVRDPIVAASMRPGRYAPDNGPPENASLEPSVPPLCERWTPAAEVQPTVLCATGQGSIQAPDLLREKSVRALVP